MQKFKLLRSRAFTFMQPVNFFKSFHHHAPLFPLLKNIESHLSNTAVIDNMGKCKFKDILFHSHQLAQEIKQKAPVLKSKARQTVPFLCANNASYVCTLLACWMNGYVAVPLCKEHPQSLLEYFLRDSESSIILSDVQFIEKIKPLSQILNIPLMFVEHPLKSQNIISTSTDSKFLEACTGTSLPAKDNGAVIIYTSGTTGPPKGVLLSHGNLHAQVNILLQAWGWKSNDIMLHVLPLHHVHGLVNCLLCPLAIGATVVMLPKFDALKVWEYFINVGEPKTKVNVFSTVPTGYVKLIDAYEDVLHLYSLIPEQIREKCSENIRLMTCGSSALPDSVFHTWEKITGQVLLERYGMSEIGMALSNPLDGARIPGSVGKPLPTVETRIVKKISSTEEEYEVLVEGTSVCEGKKAEAGELHVKGPSVFKEYWNKPEATRTAFTKDGWFKTGDIAILDNGVYRILGRESADIVKTGGYKVSALDIERHLLEHPAVSDCAVFGLPNEKWGEMITAVVAIHSSHKVSTSELNEFCKTKLPPYSVPKLFKFVDSVPRNVMGKVNKKDLKQNLLKEMKST